MSAPSSVDPHGRIPLRIRVGVTAHRTLEHPERLVPLIDEVIARVRAKVPAHPDTEMLLVAVSPLAEGADRLVARQVLETPGGRLEVPLPLPVSDYEQDFAGVGSVEEFRSLVGRAHLVVPAPPSRSRDDAYQQVGSYVVDRCDVLVAIWDGQEARGSGGTAEIVQRARDTGTPLLWIDTRGEGGISEEGAASIAAGVAAEAHAFNAPMGSRALTAAVTEDRHQLLPPDAPAVGSLDLDAMAAWMLPAYVRADRLAMGLRRRYDLGLSVILGAGAIGVLSAALHAVRWHETKELLYVEAAALSLVAMVFLWGRWRAIHPRWLAYRFLAERLRSAFFLGAAGMGPRLEGGFESSTRRDDREEWVRRAFAEVWDARPASGIDDEHAPAAGALLAAAWLGPPREEGGTGQVAYHARQSERLHRAHRRTALALGLVFTAVLLVALAHPFVHAKGLAQVLTVGSLFLPTVGGAVAALSADREHERHAERHAEMALRLARAREELRGVASRAQLEDAAEHAELVLLEENRDWFGVQRFHDFEPHA
jgi:hypothetical protein